jgi:large subunit ribosomal protein L13
MKTPSLSHKAISRNWYLVDATDATVGRVASQIASILRGKNNPFFTPHLDTGDFVVVVNAEKVRLTGKKESGKIYWRYTGFPGGERGTVAADQREKHPERLLTFAVKGMLPKGPLGRRMFKKLKVYVGTEHPHAAQQPQTLTVKS